MLEHLDKEPEDDRGISLTAPTGRIEVGDLSFAYPNGKAALWHVALRMEPAQWVALAGRTRSRKFTLLSLLLQLSPIPDGTIWFDGRDVAQLALSPLRREAPLVSQDVFLFSRTGPENVRLARARVTDAEAIAVAHALGADGFVRELPDGYRTPMGERGAKLSDGQRQLIAQARAVLRQPKVLLLDEATSALDSQSEARASRPCESSC